MYLTMTLELNLNWLGENWEENAIDEDFADDECCLDYLHRFRTIKLLQEVPETIGRKAFLGLKTVVIPIMKSSQPAQIS